MLISLLPGSVDEQGQTLHFLPFQVLQSHIAEHEKNKAMFVATNEQAQSDGSDTTAIKVSSKGNIALHVGRQHNKTASRKLSNETPTRGLLFLENCCGSEEEHYARVHL